MGALCYLGHHLLSAIVNGGDNSLIDVVHGLQESAKVPTPGALCYLGRNLPSARGPGGDNHRAMPKDTDGDLSSVACGIIAREVKDTDGDLSPVTSGQVLANDGADTGAVAVVEAASYASESTFSTVLAPLRPDVPKARGDDAQDDSGATYDEAVQGGEARLESFPALKT